MNESHHPRNMLLFMYFTNHLEAINLRPLLFVCVHYHQKLTEVLNQGSLDQSVTGLMRIHSYSGVFIDGA